MNSNKKLVSNMIYSGVGQLLILITPVLTTPYVARIFSPGSIGIYSTSYALAMFFVQIASFGIPIYGVRKIASSQDLQQRSQFFFETWLLQVIISLLSFFVYLFVVFNFYDKSVIYLTQSLLVLTNIFDVSWFFIGIEEIKKNVFRNLLSKVFAIIAIFSFVKSENDLVLYTIINVLGVLLGNISMVVQLNRFVSFKLHEKVTLHKNTMFESFGLLVPQAIDSAKNAISRIILVYFSGYVESGFYDQGLKVVILIGGVIQSLTNALTPHMTSLLSKNKKNEVLQIVEKYTIIANAVATLFVSGIIAVADNFVPIFFGKEYQHVSIIMKISSISLIFTTLSYFLGKGLLISLSRDHEYRMSTYISAITLILTNLIFSKTLGSMGAAMSFVLSAFIFLGCIVYSLKSDINVWNLIRQLCFSFFIVALVFAVTKILRTVIVIESNVVGFLVFGVISSIICLAFYFSKLKNVVNK